ncbi:hypothetical protein MP228_002508 [Amoeboaphelidium protococcarum]|nr:hypothetical protein MP228_002508 [Amoeboaphelidium protococcarum]
MACSKYEYVKKFELSDAMLPNTYIVVRIDGRGFSRFTKEHKFEKPNDLRGIQLMNSCAERVMKDFSDITLAYGQSDEYSFLISRSSNLYHRRSSKLVSTIVSLFTATYVFEWSKYFPGVALQYPPSFDGRAVSYPSVDNIRDYFSWRQVDCHINNLYNTCFWKLVIVGGLSEQAAEEQLRPTNSAMKNELLFAQFQLNYNSLPTPIPILRQPKPLKIFFVLPQDRNRSRHLLSNAVTLKEVYPFCKRIEATTDSVRISFSDNTAVSAISASTSIESREF